MEFDVDLNDVIALLRAQLADATFQVSLLMLQLEKLKSSVVEEVSDGNV